MRTTALLVVLLTALSAAGCAATSNAPPHEAPTTRTPPPASGSAKTTIPLLINGDPVTWSTLTPLLAEASGREIVRELVLESALRREVSARGLQIGDSALKQEHERWIDMLGPDLAAETEASIRLRRGLGPVRFRRMLWRNAALRALLDPAETTVTDDEVRLAKSIRTGRRFAVSIVTVPEADDAVDIARQARESPSGATAGLWEGSLRHGAQPRSTVLSPLDPAVPDALRGAIASTPIGSASGAIAIEGGYAVVLVHAVLPAGEAPPPDQSIREMLALRKARAAMERLAERLVEGTSVHILDHSLSWHP